MKTLNSKIDMAKKDKKKKKTEPVEDQQTVGNDYYAEAEGIKNLKGTTIIVNINAGQPPLPPYKP